MQNRTRCFAMGALVVWVMLMYFFLMVFAEHTDPCAVDQTVWRARARSVTVPKVVHFQWKTRDIPAMFHAYQESWVRHFPPHEYDYQYWTDDSADEFMRTHYAWFYPVYESYTHPIARADAVRYFILYHYGGIYSDLDIEVLHNFYHMLSSTSVMVVESPYKYSEYVQNSLMVSPYPKHPAWNEVFKRLFMNSDRGVLKATGPALFNDIVMGPGTGFEQMSCELYHRIPLGERNMSSMATLAHREILGRLYPMKYCGDFWSDKCQYTKHHNTAIYLNETGVWSLLN